MWSRFPRKCQRKMMTLLCGCFSKCMRFEKDVPLEDDFARALLLTNRLQYVVEFYGYKRIFLAHNFIMIIRMFEWWVILVPTAILAMLSAARLHNTTDHNQNDYSSVVTNLLRWKKCFFRYVDTCHNARWHKSRSTRFRPNCGRSGFKSSPVLDTLFCTCSSQSEMLVPPSTVSHMICLHRTLSFSWLMAISAWKIYWNLAWNLEWNIGVKFDHGPRASVSWGIGHMRGCILPAFKFVLVPSFSVRCNSVCLLILHLAYSTLIPEGTWGSKP